MLLIVALRVIIVQVVIIVIMAIMVMIGNKSIFVL